MTDLMPPRRNRGTRDVGPDEETVRLERDLFEQRRRSLRRPRRKRILVALVLVVVLVAGVWAVGFSSLLAVRSVEVSGAEQVAPPEVRAAAAAPIGRPLARVDLDAIRERVSAMPAIASVRVSRAWPHAVRVAVTERVAVAVVPRANGFRGLAADGVLFKAYAKRPPGLPEIQDQKGADKDALREAALVVGSLPGDVLRRVAHVSVKSIDEIRLVMRSGRLVVWGNSSQSQQKAAVLTVLLERASSQIDVSVPGRPTTRS